MREASYVIGDKKPYKKPPNEAPKCGSHGIFCYHFSSF